MADTVTVLYCNCTVTVYKHYALYMVMADTVTVLYGNCTYTVGCSIQTLYMVMTDTVLYCTVTVHIL